MQGVALTLQVQEEPGWKSFAEWQSDGQNPKSFGVSSNKNDTDQIHLSPSEYKTKYCLTLTKGSITKTVYFYLEKDGNDVKNIWWSSNEQGTYQSTGSVWLTVVMN